jgi:hypothetical protein
MFSLKKFVPKGNINLLNNRIILYISLFASLVNLLSFALLGEYSIPIIYILVAFVTSFFSKNMTVILLTALAISNIIKYGTKIRVEEGFQEGALDKMTTDASGNSMQTSTSSNTKKMTETLTTENETKPMTDTTKLEPSKFEVSKKQMKELLDIQKMLAKNISTVEKSLSRAEVLVENLKEGMDGMNEPNKH